MISVLYRYWFVIAAGENNFEVKNGFDGFTVNTLEKTCSCRGWQLSGIPCVHGMATIMYLNNEPDNYVSDWYTKNMFDVTYSHSIGPMNGSNMWPKTSYTKPLPPIVRTMPGMPKKKRKRDHSEAQCSTKVSSVGRVVRCKVCNQAGHNKTTCTSTGGGGRASGVAGKGGAGMGGSCAGRGSGGAGMGGSCAGRGSGAAGRGGSDAGMQSSESNVRQSPKGKGKQNQLQTSVRESPRRKGQQQNKQPDLSVNERGTEMKAAVQDIGTQESKTNKKPTKSPRNQPSKLRNKSQRIILMKLKRGPADPTGPGTSSDKPLFI